MGLHILEILLLQTLRCCRETGTQEELVKLQDDSFARDVYSEKELCKFLVYYVQLIQKIATPIIQALLLLRSSRLCESTLSVLMKIKSKLSKNART